MVVWNVAMHICVNFIVHALLVCVLCQPRSDICNYLTYVCNKTFISHFVVNMRYELLGRVNNG